MLLHTTTPCTHELEYITHSGFLTWLVVTTQLIKAAGDEEDVRLSDVLRNTVGLADDAAADDAAADEASAATTHGAPETVTEETIISSPSPEQTEEDALPVQEEDPPSTYSPLPTPRGQEEVVYEYGGYQDVYAQYGEAFGDMHDEF